MDFMNELASIAASAGGIIDTKTAKTKGISRAMLSLLNKRGKIMRVAQGQYVLPHDMQDELLSIDIRSEHIIFSHETALWLHGISDRTPFVHSLTAPSGKMPSGFIRETCKVYYIKPELFDMGKVRIATPSGNLVAAYDLERTICDCVRSRNKMGTETYLAALKAYAARKDKNLNLLNTYAVELRVAGLMRKYMEVLL